MLTSVVLLGVQASLVVAGFIGVSSAVSWYHGGGEKNGASNRKVQH